MDIITRLQDFAQYLPLMGVITCSIVILLALCYGLGRITEWYFLYRRQGVFLEITPPTHSDKNQHATAQLFSVLHGLGSTQTIKQRLLRRPMVFAPEVVSSKDKGIRFIFHVPKHEAAMYHREITAYVPDAKVQQVEDYLPAMVSNRKLKIMSFRQAVHFAFPLQPQARLENHDPIAYLTAAMTKLQDKELIAVQLVLQPAYIREVSSIEEKLRRNDDLVSELRGRGNSVLKALFSVINSLLFTLLDGVGSLMNSGSGSYSNTAQRDSYDRQQVAKGTKPARQLSAFEQELVASIHEKLQQPLFKTSIRVLVMTDTKTTTRQRLQGIRAALVSLSVPKYQSLKGHRQYFGRLSRWYNLLLFRRRLLMFMRKNLAILAVSEVADLYHFPNSLAAKTENVVKSLSRTLPAPVSLKNGTLLDVALGLNQHHGSETTIGLTTEERQRHIYVVGGTGNGKTTMLQYAIMQDINDDRGVAVVDPHGDLSQTILKHLPEHRLKDVIYFNPDDLDHPIGLNLLELTPGLTGNDLLREQDRITESVVSVFRKIFSDEDVGGHRIEYVLRNAVLTALTIPDATLFTVLKLLQNTTYRKKISDQLEDETLKDFWKNDMGQAGNMQRVKMSLGVTSKISRFHASASARLILEQPKSSIDFEDIINSGKILICNFAKGALGEDTSQLFGIATLAKLQLAAYRRVYMDESERRPFYLYVDEFQNFATTSFEQMLSESRKYRLAITMAEQSMAQQKDQQMVKVILANVGTVICFKTGNSEDERMLLPRFKPFLEEGDIQHLPAFNFFADLSAINSQEPTSGKTVLLTGSGSKEQAERIIRLSQETYGAITPPQSVEIPSSQEPSKKQSEKPPSTGTHGVATVRIPGAAKP